MVKALSIVLVCLLAVAPATGLAKPTKGRPFAQTQITIQLQPDHETVCLALNGLAQPVLSSLEGERPRIVIDLTGVGRWQGRSSVAVGGALIHQVRAYLDRPSGRLRLVVDLAPGLDYAADPVYYSENDLFCLTVRRQHP